MEVMWTTLALVAGALTLAKGRPESRCILQGTPRPASFSQPGDFVIGGVFSIHNYVITAEHNYTSVPKVPQLAVKVAFQLANGIEPIFFPNQSCSKSATVHAVVGESGSTPSIAISRILGPFGIPLVSFSCPVHQ
ncbi:hypothetical protein SKAU_G00428110 [Synaphobranchus kaupii]|uniref:Uncharacterized protein n=1 Tax=Synaphobranchus kaupii TaxID=118154 RepID=A0A9Q1I8B3_SYNKA|nr:hypothetical protein SKAU_G00428110 [Synaphobranchus kaupii]